MRPNVTQAFSTHARELARILLIDGETTSRMTLKAVLEAGGYHVSVATTSMEAMDQIDHREFELVLCHCASDPETVGSAILSYARFQPYEPATAVLSTVHCMTDFDDGVARNEILVEPQNLPDLLDQVASLIGARALSQLEREGLADRTLS